VRGRIKRKSPGPGEYVQYSDLGYFGSPLEKAHRQRLKKAREKYDTRFKGQR
jgi:hypothetical protein